MWQAAAIGLVALSLATNDNATLYALLNVAAACFAVSAAIGGAKTAPRLAAGSFIVALWLAADALATMLGAVTVDAWWYVAASGLLFGGWALKTLLLRPVRSDALTSDAYFYGLAPVREVLGVLNFARPNSIALFGGRCIVAGGWVYHVRGRHFAKTHLKNVNLTGIVFVNTNESINPETSARLDAIVGQRAIPFFRDCSSLCSQSSLERVLLKRGIVWIRMKAGRG